MNEPIFFENQNLTPQQFLRQQIFRVIHYWFIRYNPLYFFSAFCVLLGIFLISNNLVVEVDVKNWTYAHLLLVAVVQLYELLIIASIAFLARQLHQYRPTVFLILLELFFLADCTFRIETLSGLEAPGILFIVLWVILAIFKLAAISWALQLQQSHLPLIISTLAIAGIAASPFVLALPNTDSVVLYLLANWYGMILIILIILFSPTITCSIELDAWGQTVLRRAIRASWAIIIGFYFYHLLNHLIWLGQPWASDGPKGIIFLLTQITPLIVVFGIMGKQEQTTWIGGIIAMMFASVYLPAVAVNALVIAVIWGIQAWQMAKPNLYLGALLLFYLGLRILSFEENLFQPLFSMPNLILISGLVFLSWKWRLKAAIILLTVIALGGFWLIASYLWSSIISLFSFIFNTLAKLRYLFPQTAVGWGIFLLVTGFVALIAGVVINWSQRQTGTVE